MERALVFIEDFIPTGWPTAVRKGCAGFIIYLMCAPGICLLILAVVLHQQPSAASSSTRPMEAESVFNDQLGRLWRRVGVDKLTDLFWDLADPAIEIDDTLLHLNELLNEAADEHEKALEAAASVVILHGSVPDETLKWWLGMYGREEGSFVNDRWAYAKLPPNNQLDSIEGPQRQMMWYDGEDWVLGSERDLGTVRGAYMYAAADAVAPEHIRSVWRVGARSYSGLGQDERRWLEAPKLSCIALGSELVPRRPGHRQPTVPSRKGRHKALPLLLAVLTALLVALGSWCAACSSARSLRQRKRDAWRVLRDAWRVLRLDHRAPAALPTLPAPRTAAEVEERQRAAKRRAHFESAEERARRRNERAELDVRKRRERQEAEDEQARQAGEVARQLAEERRKGERQRRVEAEDHRAVLAKAETRREQWEREAVPDEEMAAVLAALEASSRDHQQSSAPTSPPLGLRR